MVIFQWLVGALLMFVLLPLCLAAIWFGVSDNWVNTLSILGGVLGLAFTFWALSKFNWS